MCANLMLYLSHSILGAAAINILVVSLLFCRPACTSPAAGIFLPTAPCCSCPLAQHPSILARLGTQHQQSAARGCRALGCAGTFDMGPIWVQYRTLVRCEAFCGLRVQTPAHAVRRTSSRLPFHVLAQPNYLAYSRCPPPGRLFCDAHALARVSNIRLLLICST